jgi:hypothetical protein
MDEDIETVLDLVVGDYFSAFGDQFDDEEVKESFKRGLHKLGDKLGVDIKKYDVDGVL